MTKPVRGVLKFKNPKINKHGSLYEPGRPFGRLKWFEVLEHYYEMLQTRAEVSIRQLAVSARISFRSARKAKEMARLGYVWLIEQGHGRVGPGSRSGLSTMAHHAHMYNLYCRNPKLPSDGYIFFMFRKFGCLLSRTTITRWFQTIGPFKGTMRFTSKFPPQKYSERNNQLLEDYLAFMMEVEDHTRLVFADEKPMKEVDLTGQVRRDPFTGEIPHVTCNANARNRYNVLAAVTLKRDVPSVQALVLEVHGNAPLFANFVGHLLATRTLQRGDIFVVDNCSIHFMGDCQFMQQMLMEEAGVLMIPLAPYYAEFNPTELVFNTLVQRMKSTLARCGMFDPKLFKEEIILELRRFTHVDIARFFDHCGYKHIYL